jgi:hypothetical protein
MVAFDASILLFVFQENVKSSIPKAKERVEYLIDLPLQERGKDRPTPALSECLVHAGPQCRSCRAPLAGEGPATVPDTQFKLRSRLAVDGRLAHDHLLHSGRHLE